MFQIYFKYQICFILYNDSAYQLCSILHIISLSLCFQYRISNIHYNVSSGDPYPIPDKSAPVYITVGDGGNQEGLAGR